MGRKPDRRRQPLVQGIVLVLSGENGAYHRLNVGKRRDPVTSCGTILIRPTAVKYLSLHADWLRELWY